MQWIPSEKKEQSDALFDGQVTEVYLIDGHALPPSAIHEALARPEQEPDDLTIAYMSGFHDGKNKYAPQHRPEQEPVAWMDECGDVLSASVVDGSGLRNIPLFTAPPKCEWVGLTDKEMEEAMDYWSDPSRSAYGGAWSADSECVDMVRTWRYIEAKLKEKNGC